MASPQDKVNFPSVTMGMLALAAVVFATPELSETFVYDRSKILVGEIWRIFTGHWVHFSTSHLVYDGIGLGVLGCLAEMRYPKFRSLYAIAPWTIGLGLLILEPGMARFGGLSAMVMAVLLFIALRQLQDGSTPKWLPITLLAGVAAKVCAELLLAKPVLVTTGEMKTIVSSSSHLLGAATAAIYAIITSRHRVAVT